MQFERFVIPGAYPDAGLYFAYMAEVKRHWRSVGWEEVPKADEDAIKAAWIANLEPTGDLVIPEPSRTWRGERLARHRQEPEMESEFTLALLKAFRQCTRPGERLWAIDWQHAWYYFDPHAGITTATRDEWAMPILPDGDSYNYVAPDFRFGVQMGWSATGPVTIFGEDLIAAFDSNPPECFLWVCGSGYLRRRRTSG
ncbi:MAG: DUF2716 domain-containing protein [Zavarzinella sp.]